MGRYFPYGGEYDLPGFPNRNRTVDAPPVNPLPPNAMTADTGNAGQDGYTVYSRADRRTGWRPDIGPNYQEFHGPKPEEDC